MAAEKFSAAIDFSGPFAALAVVGKNGGLLIDKSKLMRREEAAEMSLWIETALAEIGININDVADWTVGSGPGSFTGMRIAASLAAGWSFQKKAVSTRTVPSAFAVAAHLDFPESGRSAILFDGRNREIMFYAVEKSSGKFCGGNDGVILNSQQAVEYFAKNQFDAVGALAYDIDAIRKIVPSELEIQSIDRICPADLLSGHDLPFDNNLTGLIYIRPSVTK